MKIKLTLSNAGFYQDKNGLDVLCLGALRHFPIKGTPNNITVEYSKHKLKDSTIFNIVSDEYGYYYYMCPINNFSRPVFKQAHNLLARIAKTKSFNLYVRIT